MALLGVLALTGAACKKSVAPNVAATVNGRPITNEDLDKQYKRSFPNQPEGAPADQLQFQKLELLRVMIDEEIMLQRAEKLRSEKVREANCVTPKSIRSGDL